MEVQSFLHQQLLMVNVKTIVACWKKGSWHTTSNKRKENGIYFLYQCSIHLFLFLIRDLEYVSAEWTGRVVTGAEPFELKKRKEEEKVKIKFLGGDREGRRGRKSTSSKTHSAEV